MIGWFGTRDYIQAAPSACKRCYIDQVDPLVHDELMIYWFACIDFYQ